jgi:outer membrane protein assembly factor BamD
MDELRNKLVYKAYLSAKLYFDLGNYMGNNYKAAVITAQNTLKKYPDTEYREELSFLILESKFIQAVNSVPEKMEERARDTIDEYYSFINEFPESKYLKKAERIYQQSQNML